jgi:glycosyltransferase involved in cell wall biosynthesis
MNLIVIPCFRRPEFLAICLEEIAKAENSNQYYYLFCADEGYDPTIRDVLKNFPLKWKFSELRDKIDIGNNQNVLEGLRWGFLCALNSGASTVHLIEEDVIISKDYFTFHEEAQKRFENNLAIFAIIGSTSQQATDLYFDPKYSDSSRYQGIGVSFNLKNLNKVIRHCNNFYYEDPQNYLRATFPSSKYPLNLYTQDRLIDRIIERNNMHCIYPGLYPAVAKHCGYYGMNHSGCELQGTLEQKINQFRNYVNGKL